MWASKWIKIEGDNISCYDYGRHPSGAVLKTIVYTNEGRLEPVMKVRDLSKDGFGEIGKDCYADEDLGDVVLSVTIETNDRGGDFSAILIRKGASISQELLDRVREDISGERNRRYLEMLLRRAEKVLETAEEEE